MNERLPNVNYEWEEALFGIPLQSDDDDSNNEEIEVDSDEDYDNFWKDGRLVDPTSEQMLQPPLLPSGKLTNSLMDYF